DLRVGAASSSRERAGFGAFVSSLLSFGTQRTLGYASLVMVLAFAAIFGWVKLRTAPEQPPQQAQQPQQKPQDQVAVGPPSVSSVPSVSKTEPRKNTDRSYKAVKAAYKVPNTPVAPAPAPEQVKLLPGERAYLQTIAKLDSTIKQKAMRPSLQV